VFIYFLLVLGKNPCSKQLNCKKIAKNWRFSVCTKLNKMTLVQSVFVLDMLRHVNVSLF